MAVELIDVEQSADFDLTIAAAAVDRIVYSKVPNPVIPIQCQGFIKFGDGTKDLDGTGGDFQITVVVGGQTIQPSPQIRKFSTDVRTGIYTVDFVVPPADQVDILVLSPNALDIDVTVTAGLYQLGADSAKVAFLADMIAGERRIKKELGIWYVITYHPTTGSEITRKALKDWAGVNINDLPKGTLAWETTSSIAVP